ncbi:MAG: hypothetical protein ACLGGV_02710 [Bacteroidia bacterium]
MNSKKIGRVVLLKYCIISLIAIFIIPIIIGIILKIFTNNEISIVAFFENISIDLQDNLLFTIIQFFVTLTLIWLIGGITGKLILDKNKSKFLIGSLAFFTLWIFLFISCAITTEIEKLILSKYYEFTSGFLGWVYFGLLQFLILGLIHGLIMGYFLGKDIEKRGKN